MGNGALRRAVFLDRDGVVNDAVVRDGIPHPPDLEELAIAFGAAQALKTLHDADYTLLVVTNQPDVARGRRSREEIDAIHATLARELPLDGFFVCPHDDADHCACRKPLPGLIFAAAREHEIDLSSSYLVGDRWRDIGSAQAAGVTSVFIDHAYAERRPDPPADATVSNLQGAVEWILNRDADERQSGFRGRP